MDRAVDAGKVIAARLRGPNRDDTFSRVDFSRQ